MDGFLFIIRLQKCQTGCCFKSESAQILYNHNPYHLILCLHDSFGLDLPHVLYKYIKRNRPETSAEVVEETYGQELKFITDEW